MRDGLKALQRFNQKVARLEASGFAKRYSADIPNVVAKFDDLTIRNLGDGKLELFGRVDSYLENFNQDEIDAFVLTHCILTQNNDPLSMASLAKIYAQPWMPKEAKAPFNDARGQAR